MLLSVVQEVLLIQ